MTKIRSQGIIRPKISTMPRNQSEASSQLDLYKLVVEQQRIKQELAFIEQRTVLLKNRLCKLKSQIEETETTIQKLRHSESRVAHKITPQKVFENKSYQAFEIEYH